MGEASQGSDTLGQLNLLVARMFVGLLCGQSLPPLDLPEMRTRKAAIQCSRGLVVPLVGF